MFAGAGAERGMGISASRGRAGPLNPRTPARPDLKSGAVVLAWLPPRPAHRAHGIMVLGSKPGCARSRASLRCRHHGPARGDGFSESLLPAAVLGPTWVDSTAAPRS